MKKKKIQLKNLEVKSFVTNAGLDADNTVKANGGGFLSLFGNTCRGGCNDTNYCSISCNGTCTCYTQVNNCTDFCVSQGGMDTECQCQ